MRSRASLAVLAAACLTAGAAVAAAPAAVAPPNDPLFVHQWNLRAIGLPAAWASSRGAGATVAVLDTGVAYETRGRYRLAPDLAGTRFVAGWDFVDGDAHPNDLPRAAGGRGHGTQMAGIIAQTTGNAIGTAGVAPAAAIMPVRVLTPELTGSATAVARGLRYAADHGADVANLSLTGHSRTRAVARAIDYAIARGVVVVAAAGNDGAASVSWPAADPDVVAVGAVSRDLTRARYSNHGAALDLVAPAGAGERVDTGRGPGDGVLAQTVIGEPSQFCFCFSASTSAAAAEVSGVAALLVASGRARGVDEVRAALLQSARDLGPPGHDAQYGAGLVQAASALERVGAAQAAAREPDGPDVWPKLALAAVALAAIVLVALARRRGTLQRRLQ